ncbi:MAG: sigma-70 family RNA polymerase sigma factor [Bacteroidales bacterium]|jgi:RNA polymerase sigma-70 factor (ECF subfamily)|nr:sigma-70 family RNA polymerase sigma factor [Bacteroidales bacterium]
MQGSDTLLASQAALAGDKDAFCHLVERYQSPVRRFLLYLSGNEELSKDIAQETFIRAWLGIGSFRALSKFSTWLFRIAYNVFCDFERSKKVFEPIDENINFANQIADTKQIDVTNIDFETVLNLLKPAERAAALLFYQEDRSVKEIAHIMNIPAGTVKSHLARGREKLIKFFRNDEL